MSPRRDAHWEIIRRIVRALDDRFGMDVKVKSDVRIDFPGHLNGFAPDVAKLGDGAEMVRENGRRRWRHQDVEFVAEVISEATRHNDYGRKCEAYATAEVPVYLIVDPYTARCHVFTRPKGSDYLRHTTVPFGEPVDLTGTPVDLVLPTGDFPREGEDVRR